MFKYILWIGCLLFFCLQNAHAKENLKTIDNILVEKSIRKMYLRHGDEVVHAYHISLGPHPEGHKEKEGDGRTPEGKYIISARNSHSKFHLSLRVSYPNAEDKIKAEKKKVSPGGDIMIHGTPNGIPSFIFKYFRKKDWTAGCIAVTNDEIEEIWDLVSIGTPIEIKP